MRTQGKSKAVGVEIGRMINPTRSTTMAIVAVLDIKRLVSRFQLFPRLFSLLWKCKKHQHVYGNGCGNSTENIPRERVQLMFGVQPTKKSRGLDGT